MTVTVTTDVAKIGKRIELLLQSRAARVATLMSADAARSVSNRYPPASVAGQPPRLRTGRMMRSIRGFVRRRFGALSIVVEAKAPYARYLEHGTRRMAARPFLGPTLARFSQRIVRLLFSRGLR